MPILKPVKSMLARYIGLVLFSFFLSQPSNSQHFDFQTDFQVLLNSSRDTSSDFFYPKLLERFSYNDSTLGNKELMVLQIGFTQDTNYKPKITLEKEKEILDLIYEKEYEKAVVSCNQILKKNPLSLTAMFEKSYALIKMNNPMAYFHKEKALKIINAILLSGEGSIEKPYFIFGLLDGQILIKFFLENSIESISNTVNEKNIPLEIIEYKKGGILEKKYFNIQIPVEKSQKQ